MKTVTVGFSHSNSLFSKLIMWVTKSTVSHTYIRIGSELVFQASGLSVNEMGYLYFLTYETIVKEIEVQLSDEQFARGEEFRKYALGKPYSIKELLGFIWVLFMKAQGKKVPNPFRDGNKSFVCSELVVAYLGMNDFGENITPDELMKMLDK